MIKKAILLTGSLTLVLPMGLAVVSCGDKEVVNKDVEKEMNGIINDISFSNPTTSRLTIEELDMFPSAGSFTKTVVSQLGLSYKGYTHEDVFAPGVPHPISMKYSKNTNVTKVPGKTVKYTFDVFLQTTIGKTSSKSFTVTSKDRVKSTPGNVSKPITAEMIAKNPNVIVNTPSTQFLDGRTTQATRRTIDWEYASSLLSAPVDGIEEGAFNPSNPEFASFADKDFLKMDYLVVPSTVKMIGKGAFEGNTLKTVDLTSANNLVLMEENAFKGNEITELIMDAEVNASLTVGLGVFEGAKLTELPEALQGDSDLAEAFKPFEENFKGSAAGSVDAIAQAEELLESINGNDATLLSTRDYLEIEADLNAFTNISYEELKELLVGDNQIDAMLADYKFGEYFDDLKFSLNLWMPYPEHDAGYSKTYDVEMSINLYGKEVTLSNPWKLESLPLDNIEATKVILDNLDTQSFNLRHDYFEIEGREIDFENISWNEFKTLLLPLNENDTYDIDDLIDNGTLGAWFNDVRFTIEIGTGSTSNANNSKTFSATVKVTIEDAELTLADSWTLVSKPFNNPLNVSELNQSQMITTSKTLVEIKQALNVNSGDIENRTYQFTSITDLNTKLGTSYVQVTGANSYEVKFVKKAETFKMGDNNAAIIYGITITPNQLDGSSQEEPTSSNELYIIVPKDGASKNFMKFSEGITKAFNGNIFSVMDGSSVTQIRDKVGEFIDSNMNKITSWDVMQLFFNKFTTYNTGYATFEKTAAEQFADWSVINPSRDFYLKVAFRDENNFANENLTNGKLNSSAGVLELNIHSNADNSKLGTFNFGIWNNYGISTFIQDAEVKLFALNASDIVFVESELRKTNRGIFDENGNITDTGIYVNWATENSSEFAIAHSTASYVIGASIGREKGYKIEYKLNSIAENGDLEISIRGSRNREYVNPFIIQKAW